MNSPLPPPPPSFGAVPPGYQPYGMAGGMPTNYAGWGSRVGGHLINGLMAALFSIPAVIGFFAGPKKTEVCTINNEVGLCKVPTGAGWAIILLLGLAGLVAFAVLYSRMISKTGQAWGHKAVGVRIVDAQTGGNIGAGKAVARYFIGHWIDGLICYLGYLWPLWDSRKQTLSDKIFGTVSIKA